MSSPSPVTLAVWTRLIGRGREMVAAIDEALAAEGLPALSWYDALLEIERAGDGGLRPFELKERLLLPQYFTSRLLDRIEKAGYVDRRSCSSDGRGHVVTITAEGRSVRRRMWRVYRSQLIGRIEDRLSPGEASALADLLEKLAP